MGYFSSSRQLSLSVRRSCWKPLLVLGFFAVSTLSQSQSTESSTTVPALVKYSGTVGQSEGSVRSRLVGLTFALYKEQNGGTPLWLETQSVQLDNAGHYVVQLGSSQPNGLPKELFASGEARWLGVQPEGQAEQPRVLLLSVPYALKAADAETIGGLPPSAFVLAVPPTNTTAAASTSAPASVLASTAASAATAQAPTATLNYIPIFTDSSGTLGNSAAFQSGTGTTAKIGINTTTPGATLDVKGTGTVRGLFTLSTTGVATATKGSNSQPMAMTASVFNSGTNAAVNKSFRWQAEPAGNNTASPSATLNLLFASGTSTPAETGLRIGSNGQITFASGQSFPGAGTILGVTAGSGLTGGGTNGNVTLNLDTTKIPQLNVANTFTGNQTVSGNLSATGAVTGSSFLIGSNLFAYGSLANSNAFLGFGGSGLNTGTQNTSAGAVALSSNTSGSQNTAVGASALSLNSTGAGNTALGVGALNASSTGSNNTASGNAALQSNTSGSYNTANGLDALFNNTTGSFNSALGYLAGPDSAHPNLTNSTAIGSEATVTASNSIVLGSISGVNGAGSNTNVGIGTTAPAFALDVHGTGNFTGPVTFAASQTFPNTISGVTAGAGLTGGGTTGNVTLNLDTTKVVTGVAAGTGLTGGGTGGALTLSLDTTKVPLLSAANTFTGNQLVAGNLNATGNLTANGSINGSSEVLTGTGSILLRVNQNSTSANSYGIIAQTTGPSAIGVYGQANDSNGIGVEGLNNSATGGFGVFGGVNNTSGVGVGVWGKTGSGTGSSIGVEADAFSPTGIGLYATNPAGGYAAKFAGAVQVMGDFSGTGNVSGTTVNATSAFSVGGTPFAFGSFSQLSAFLGFSGGVANTAQRDTANGVLALAVDTGGSNTASGTLALRNNTTGTSNTATGDEALSSNTIGAFNMADGFTAMLGNTSGSNNTAGGAKALLRNTIGGSNTAFGFAALFYNNDGVGNTAIGNLAGPDVTHGSLTNSTAIGANAEVTASNSLVLGSINGVNGATASTNVGIGTTAPTYLLHIGNQGTSSSFFRVEGPLNPSSGGMAASFGGYGDLGIDAPGIVSGRFVVKESGNVGVGLAAPTHIFQVGQGLGAAFADSWLTYSSRRWKTKIQTLPNALAKVEQLRGVSYDLKGSGKHEIGVIAEEVGQVVPEVVSFEENGKDAQGVDYSRLTALLIEAVKQQQRQIQGEQTTAREQQRELQQEQTQLAKALRQIKQQQRLLRAQASAMRSLKNEVRETRETLQKLNLKAPASQPGLLAAK